MELIAEYGYAGLFLISFLAATILPVVAEPFLSAMLIAGYPVHYVVLVATLGNWMGGLTTYGLGYLGKIEWLEKWFRVSHEKAMKFQQRIEKFGPALAFFSWVPFLGDPLTVSLGLFKVRFPVVAIWMLAGKFLRYLAWGLLTTAGISFFS